MYVGYTAGVELHVPDGIVQNTGRPQHCQHDNDQYGRAYIIDDMDQGCADLVRFGSDPADDKGRDTVTDINADDNGKHAAEIQSHRAGQGLQDTDDRRRALDNAGDNNA